NIAEDHRRADRGDGGAGTHEQARADDPSQRDHGDVARLQGMAETGRLVHAVRRPARMSRFTGNSRRRMPVAAAIALTSDGGPAVQPGSPMPPGAPLLLMMCTSMAGASLIRIMR